MSVSAEVPLRIYQPAASRSSNLPTVVWFHGGGWICGTIDSEGAQCRRVASGLPCIVVSVDYGLLPKNTTAGMLADCLAAFDWARENAGGYLDRVVVMGGSAGGAPAFGTVYRLGQLGRETELKGVAGMFPVTVHSKQPPEKYAELYRSHEELESTAPVIRGAGQLGIFELSVERSPEGRLRAAKFSYDEPALKKFPRTYMVTAQKDLMRDDGVVLEAALQDAGVQVKRDRYMGMLHYFWFFSQLEKASFCMKNAIKGLEWVLNGRDEGGLAINEI
ncbi:Alpha/beta hydrolase fold-3 [Macrophomina phaseolina MS6]|uniref:Alpha/beta hydrolase fold-3 n=1 Tax=Macrophomina phaseolina (strain MS6) TaxID=1126212 RepID=K2SB24_MACPH|nr:Alpha/beta hydrolase fold-3 [Macrophomina phaseolina MS6]